MEAVNISKDDEKKKKGQEEQLLTVTGLTATQSARVSAEAAAQRFAKPQEYTGNRTLYDSGSAKRQAKMDLFGGSAQVKDPYTGEILTLTKAEAKLRFGDDWTKHLAESDHIHPLERIHSEHRSDAFLTNDNIRDAANSLENMEVTSRQLNNAKRSRTNEEFMRDSEYREGKGIKLSEESEREAVSRGREAKSAVDRRLRTESFKNAVSTFHDAGMHGAINSGASALTMAGVYNVVAVLKGEKDAGEAVVDTLKAGGAGAATGYAMSGGLTLLSQKLSTSTSELMRTIGSSGLPGQIVTAVMVVGGTLKRYASGEIDTEEFIIELGDKGAGFAAGSYGFAIGQAMIPIPVVGGLIGSMVGYALSGAVYGKLREALTGDKLAREERLRIERECAEAIAKIREYRAQMEEMISRYLVSHIKTFREAFNAMGEALSLGDADKFITGANMITKKLGGHVQFEDMRGFDALMMSEEAFVL